MRIKPRIYIVRNSLMTPNFSYSVLFPLSRKQSLIGGVFSESTSSYLSSFELGDGADAGAGSELGMLCMMKETLIEN